MPQKVTSARKLLKLALRDFWKHRWQFLGLVAIVAVPLAILNNISGLAGDGSFSAYSSFATLIMNVALIWLIVQIKAGKRVKIRDAYYFGTSSLIRFLLIAVALTLMLIPFLVGATIYISGVTGATLNASTPEKVLLALLWFVFTLPTLWLIGRYILSLYVIVAEDTTPIGALRKSGGLIKGRVIKVLGRLFVLGIISIVALAIPALIVNSAQGVLIAIGITLLQLISTLFILPISNLYLYSLYQSLSGE